MKQRILVIGAGFAGVWSALSAVRLLEQEQRIEDISVCLLAPQAEQRIRPRFHQEHVSEMSVPLDELFAATGIEFIQGSAETIDAANRQVVYHDAQGKSSTIDYQRLILASGSQAVHPEHIGLEYAFDIDQFDHAIRLEQHMKDLAHEADSPTRNTVIVIGGGFTGIEIATEMPQRLKAALGDDADVRVVVIDRGPEIAGSLGEGPRSVIREAIDALAIEWRTSSEVATITANGVTLQNGEQIASRTVIWTAGVTASPLTAQIPAERDALGRLQVADDLQVQGQEAIFACGDVARAAVDDAGHHALMTCQHAIPMGRFAGNNAAASLIGVATLPYRQELYVTCLDLGTQGAVYTEGWQREVKLTGSEAKKLKNTIVSEWIYPPRADRATALAAADPMNALVE